MRGEGTPLNLKTKRLENHFWYLGKNKKNYTYENVYRLE